MHHFGRLVLLILVAPAGALAERYWVSYEGTDFPENEGWARTFSDPNGVVGQGGAIRTIENGALVLDSRESVNIVDFYNMSRLLDPEPGETFVLRWRLRVDEIPSSVPYDLSIGVFSDDFRAVGLQFAVDGLRSAFESREHITYLPGVFHQFEFVSDDMLSYELFMDGAPFLSGDFVPVGEASRIGWGDGIQGARSLSTWDRLGFGVVPEPASVLLVLLGLSLLRLRSEARS